MVEEEPVKDVKRPSGLEGEDVWGDAADDPVDELTGLSDAELINKTRDLESSIRRAKQNITAVTQQNKGLDARI